MVMSEDYPGAPRRYQHGDNPEAMIEVSRFDCGTVRVQTGWAFLMDGRGDVVPPSVVDDWVDRVHAYEDGSPRT